MSYDDFVDRHLATYREELVRSRLAATRGAEGKKWIDARVAIRKKILEYQRSTPEEEEAILDLVRPRLREMLAAHREVDAAGGSLEALYLRLGPEMLLSPAVWLAIAGMVRQSAEPVLYAAPAGVNRDKRELALNAKFEDAPNPGAGPCRTELRSLFGQMTRSGWVRPKTKRRSEWIRQVVAAKGSTARAAVFRAWKAESGLSIETLRKSVQRARPRAEPGRPGRPKKTDRTSF